MSLLRAGEAFSHALLEDDPAALYERAPCGYLSTTPDGVIIKTNATFLDWTGYSSKDVLGRALSDLLSRGGRIFYETHYAPMLHMQGFVRELAVDLVCADGVRLPVLLNARLDADTNGLPRVVRLAVFDATERRRYEEELLRTTRAAQEARDRAEQDSARAEQAELATRALVETLQQTLVPRSLPHVEGLSMQGAFHPAGAGAQVGGDFYGVYPTSADECWLVLGDVSGKGVEAAVVTSMVRHATRALATLTTHPVEALARLNDLVCADDTDRYCTVVLARMSRRDDGCWEVVYAAGGHPPGLVCGPGREAHQLDPLGQVVGLVEDAAFEAHTLVLTPGQTLLLYTDGVTEARNGLDFFGDQRLLAVATAAAEGGAPTIVGDVVGSVLDFQDNHPRDDIACLAVSVH